MSSDLTSSKAPRSLSACEAVIERGLQTFVEVGQALLEIRDGRLYREVGYSRFEDYCKERWGWGRHYANRIIGASEVAQMVPIVTNEAQARELAPLRDDPEAMQGAWDEAVERSSGTPTAKAVREVVIERTTEVECEIDDDEISDLQRVCPTCGQVIERYS